jgi:hypothetical protein
MRKKTHKILFFKIPLDEYSYDTPYLQDCSEKKMFLKTFFLREFSTATPIGPSST